MQTIIDNIKEVRYRPYNSLATLTIVPTVGCFVNQDRNWLQLPVVGLADYVCASVTDNKSTTYEHSLSCVLSQDFIVPKSPIALLLVSVSGNKYIIIGSDPLQPVVKTSIAKPSSPTDKSACSLSISLKSPHSVLKVLDL